MANEVVVSKVDNVNLSMARNRTAPVHVAFEDKAWTPAKLGSIAVGLAGRIGINVHSEIRCM